MQNSMSYTLKFCTHCLQVESLVTLVVSNLTNPYRHLVTYFVTMERLKRNIIILNIYINIRAADHHMYAVTKPGPEDFYLKNPGVFGSFCSKILSMQSQQL